MKFNVYISNHEAFARNSHSACYSLQPDRHMDSSDWTFAGEVEFYIDVDTKEVIQVAKDNLTAEIGRHTAAITVLENRKRDLLSITHDKSFSQQDRVLANGDIKTSTGEILEPTCRTADDCRDAG